ncbi:MAG: cell division protein FtsI [Clostridiales bacterium]|nr:cell division protein FtsI [Candidatus Blautia equi]
MRKKLVMLYIGVVLALVGLMMRITYINATSGDKYKKMVLSQAQSKYESAVLPSKRGDIYDRNGNVLATSSKVYNVVLDCKAVNEADEWVRSEYRDATIKALVDFFELEEAKLLKLITSDSTKNSQYQVIKKTVPVDKKKDFENFKAFTAADNLSEEQKTYRNHITGVWFEEDYLRSYPFESLACDTIGFTFSRDTADWGIEGYYNTYLTGADGRQYGYFSNSSDVEQTIIEPTNGRSLELSLDVGAQQIVEKYVNAFNEAMGAKHVGVVVEDPSTGEILAMDGGDRYDLNHPRDLSYSGLYSDAAIEAMNDEQTVEALNSMWSNFCITDAYEPGSVVKPIVMASALEKGAISTSDMFVCDGGQQFGTDTFIKCAVYPDAHGDETLADVIANSCNDGMMQIAARMGDDQFIKAQSLFNFGSYTGLDLPNEGSGIIHTTDTMGTTELACSSFGQGFTCTMIQEINAMCSVINGGYYYQPHLVTKIKDSNGNIIKNITPTLMKQTISAQISENVRKYMQASVEHGTSYHSKVQGYSSGGKTGTAEKIPRGNRKYLVSFIGFAPVSDPKVVVYVVVDEPNAEEQATSSFPQYIAQGILSELLPYLNVFPDESGGYYEETELWEGFKGHLQNISGPGLDAEGNLVDGAGNLIDLEGNRIDNKGYLVDDHGNRLVNDDGEYMKSPYLVSNVSDDLQEAVSNTNIPAPLQSDEDPLYGNDMESDGVTNEEAGYE